MKEFLNSLTISVFFKRLLWLVLRKWVGRGWSGKRALVGGDRGSDHSFGHGDAGEGNRLSSIMVWNQEGGTVIIGV